MVQRSAVQWGHFLLGGGNLTRTNFDHSENCYLVGGNEPLVGGRESTGGEFFLVGGMSKFSASGGGGPPLSPQ